MKFICEKEKLLSALSITSRTVSTKSNILALEGILIQADEKLTVTGYNLETGIESVVSAEIEERGSLVLSSRLFLDIVRKIPNERITFSSKDYWVTITCGKIQFQIMAIDSADYPELPLISDNQSLVMTQPLLRSMISTTLFAVSSDDSRPIHTGSLFEVERDKLTIVSVDGYRLALRRETVDTVVGIDNFSFVVPKSALSEVEKICTTEEDVTISVSDKHVLFQMNDSILVTRRLEGEFLSYKTAIPSNNTGVVKAVRRDLLSTIDRVSLMISEKAKAPLCCKFGSEFLDVSSKTSLGEANDICAIEGNGDDIEIGFNHRYMQEALRFAPGDEIRLEFSTPVAPCLIMPEDEGDDSFCYMVLPVRLKA